MKKIISFVLFFTLLFSSNSISSCAKQSLKLLIEDKYVKTEYIILNGRTFVEPKVFEENFGVEYQYNDKEVKIVNGNNDTMLFWIDTIYYTLNGQFYSVEDPPIIRNSKVYLPLRFLSESLGSSVKWDAESRIITINREQFICSPQEKEKGWLWVVNEGSKRGYGEWKPRPYYVWGLNYHDARAFNKLLQSNGDENVLASFAKNVGVELGKQILKEGVKELLKGLTIYYDTYEILKKGHLGARKDHLKNIIDQMKSDDFLVITFYTNESKIRKHLGNDLYNYITIETASTREGNRVYYDKDKMINGTVHSYYSHICGDTKYMNTLLKYYVEKEVRGIKGSVTLKNMAQSALDTLIPEPVIMISNSANLVPKEPKNDDGNTKVVTIINNGSKVNITGIDIYPDKITMEVGESIDIYDTVTKIRLRYDNDHSETYNGNDAGKKLREITRVLSTFDRDDITGNVSVEFNESLVTAINPGDGAEVHFGVLSNNTGEKIKIHVTPIEKDISPIPDNAPVEDDKDYKDSSDSTVDIKYSNEIKPEPDEDNSNFNTSYPNKNDNEVNNLVPGDVLIETTNHTNIEFVYSYHLENKILNLGNKQLNIEAIWFTVIKEGVGIIKSNEIIINANTRDGEVFYFKLTCPYQGSLDYNLCFRTNDGTNWTCAPWGVIE